MEPTGSALIDFAEAAYDLQADDEDWLAQLIAAGAPALDRGLGVFGFTCFRTPQPGHLVIHQLHAEVGLEELADRVLRLESEIPPDILWTLSRPAMPMTLSEAAGENIEALNVILAHFDFAKDGLGMSTFDPNGHGVYLITPLPKVTSLTNKSRERFQMLAAHFGAGSRLRRALAEVASRPTTELPLGAEVVIDPAGFKVTDATGHARSSGARSALREAALRLDRVRGRMRKSDPEKALELWRALVRGRWSAVDWFDYDGRRYVLGVPNAPNVSDPRGLTDRELQAVTYAMSGQTNKLIAYQLGLSKGRVSALMSSAMRKLGVQTRAQLITRLREFSSSSAD